MIISTPNPTFGNPRWNESTFHVLILRLSSFQDVERSTPHLFLALEARKGAPHCFIDMAFLPQPSQRMERAQSGLPLILGTQSERPLPDFDLVLISNSCVPELVNLPFLLCGSGIPIWAAERGEDLPAIILGGSSSAAAHAIVREDGGCMADALFFGEGEGAVQRIVEFWCSSTGRPKRSRLSELADRVQGIWPWGDPSRTVLRAVRPEQTLPGLNGPYPILPGSEADTARLEITLGCPCLCSFCFEGHDRAPFRQFALADLLDAARRMKAASGARILEIASYNFNTHEEISELLLELNRIFFRVNAMSQRIDILARDAELLDAEIAADKRSFTLGIEGISDRQRKYLHKSLDMRDIMRVLDSLHKPKVRELKLFLLITGREEDRDFSEFALFIRALKELRRSREAKPRLIFSFGRLVRMPFTPLRYDGLILTEKAWKPLIGKAKSICETNGFEFRLSSEWRDYLITQLLALGGPRVHELMSRLVDGGIVYDRAFAPNAQAIVETWMAENEAYVQELSRPKEPERRFPLDFIDSPEQRSFLWKQFDKAQACIDEGYCRRGTPRGCDECLSCTRIKKTQTPARRKPPATQKSMTAQRISNLVKAKSRLVPIHLPVHIPPEAATSSVESRSAHLMRDFLSRVPKHIDNVLSIEETLVSEWMGDAANAEWYGRGVAQIIAWDHVAVLKDLKSAGGAVAPAVFEWIDLAIVQRDNAPPDAEARFLEALRSQHAKFTLRRDGNTLRLEFADQTVRRKIAFGASCEAEPGGPVLRIRAGRKLDARSLFGGLGGVRIEVISFI